MGLDMYLTKRIYIGAQFDHRRVEGEVRVSVDGRPVAVDLSRVSEIVEAAGYWRKANAVHGWLVANLQGGVDDCRDYPAPYEKLCELAALCRRALETRDPSGLPPTGGFFFGSTEVDDGYFDDLRHTVEIVESLDPEADYYYQASW